MGSFKCIYYVNGIAGSGKPYENIAPVSNSLNQPRINYIEAVVIGNSCQVRSITMKGISWQSIPVSIKTARKFCSQVLSVGCTASISAKIDPVAVFQCLHHFGCN